MMPGYKRMESSSPQHARRSRRIANLTGNNGVAAPVKNEDNVADILDETDEDGPSHDTDDDYSSDDEDVENEIDEDGFRAFDKDAEYQKRYIVQDEHTGRVVTIIPHETLRPINGVEYSDYKIHKNTLLYLMDLRANNRRSWFKRKYKRSKLKDLTNSIRPSKGVQACLERLGDVYRDPYTQGHCFRLYYP